MGVSSYSNTNEIENEEIFNEETGTLLVPYNALDVIDEEVVQKVCKGFPQHDRVAGDRGAFGAVWAIE